MNVSYLTLACTGHDFFYNQIAFYDQIAAIVHSAPVQSFTMIGNREFHIQAEIPHLRRAARLLRADVRAADDLVCEALKRAVAETDERSSGITDRVRLWTHLGRSHKGQSSTNSKGNGRWPRTAEARESDGFVQGDQHELEACFRRLDDQDRFPLILVSVRGFSYEEAALVLGKDVEYVVLRLAKARRSLMKGMREAHSRIDYRTVALAEPRKV